jgi:Flp pilus assembly protein TadB
MAPRSFDEELGRLLTAMASAMRGGATLEVALLACGELAAPELRAEARRILAEVSGGGGRGAAFRGLATRHPGENTELVASAVEIAETSGGDLAGILDTTSATIRERTALAGELRTKTAHARLSGLVVGLAPLVVVAVLSLIAPDYLRPALHSSTGRLLFVIAGILVIAGIGLIQVLLRIRPSGGMQRGLANTLDVITVSVEAGWSFDQAAAAVAARMTTPLAVELRTVMAEIAAGRPRAEAMQALAERTGSDDIAAFTTYLVMSEQTGTSLGSVLRIHGAEIRRRERHRLQRRINRAPVLMMLPLAICIMPALLLALLAPTIVRVLGLALPWL